MMAGLCSTPFQLAHEQAQGGQPDTRANKGTSEADEEVEAV
jgi:hypothetical protein